MMTAPISTAELRELYARAKAHEDKALFGRRWNKVFSDFGTVAMRFEMPTYRLTVDGEADPRPQWGFVIRRHYQS